jgi:hypothetical protein
VEDLERNLDDVLEIVGKLIRRVKILEEQHGLVD